MSNANNDPLGDRGNAGPQPAAGQPYYQQPAYGSPQPSRGGRFFAWIRSSQVKRGHDRWIGGVCDGIARRLGWNTTLVRALVVVATLFSARVPRSMVWRGLCCRMSVTIRFLLRI